eukprot:m.42319 g.42319  ORF g.42319 m.42319 type:complete len:1102 (+) comp9871_c0_seq1:32-3337(+)
MARTAVLLVFGLSLGAARDCTKDDYKLIYTPCKSGFRNHVVVQMNDCDEAGIRDEIKSTQSFNVPCDCQNGTYRDNDGSCQECELGHFNPGGISFDKSEFSKPLWNTTGNSKGTSRPLGLDGGVSIYCSGENCVPWTASSDGEYLHSGNNKDQHNLESVLEITKYFDRELGSNKVYFQYRVDAELCSSSYMSCDGLSFYVDNQRVLPPPTSQYSRLNRQVEFAKFEFTNISKGAHTLKWKFSKDSGIDQGEDMAQIKHIVLVGATSKEDCFSDSASSATSCYECPSGTYGDEKGMSECKPCDWGTYQDQTGSSDPACKPCKDGEESVPGSHSCRPLPNCTKDDYIIVVAGLDSCQQQNGNWTRAATSKLMKIDTPDKTGKMDICNSLATQEIPDQTVSCDCHPGKYFDSGSKECKPCPVGKYRDSGMPECLECPLGQRSIPGIFIEGSWADIPIQQVSTMPMGKCPSSDMDFCATCVGDGCGSTSAWKVSSKYATTGRNIGNLDNLLIYQGFQPQNGTSIKITCAIDCMLKDLGKEAREEVCNMNIKLVNGSGMTPEGLEYSCGVADGVTFGTNRNGAPSTKTLRIPEEDTSASWSIVVKFEQREEDTNAAFESFEGRIHNIIVENTKSDNGAKECRACPRGMKLENQNCVGCGAGSQASSSDPTQCEPCPENMFSDEFDGPCKPCGMNTVSNNDHTACDPGEDGICRFTGEVSGRKYDMTKLGTETGDMAFGGQEYSQSGGFFYYLNPCYTTHNNTACTDQNNNTLPYMICQVEPGLTPKVVIDLGTTIGYTEVEPNHVKMTFLSHLTCDVWKYGEVTQVNRSSTIHLRCADVGVGKPVPTFYKIEASICDYQWDWDSIYGCPVCSPDDFVVVKGPCNDGKRTQKVIQQSPCQGDYLSATGKTGIPTAEVCVSEEAPEKGRTFLVGKTVITTNSSLDLDLFPSRFSLEMRNITSRDVFLHGISGNDANVTIEFVVDVEEKDSSVALGRIKMLLNGSRDEFGKLDGDISVLLPVTIDEVEEIRHPKTGTSLSTGVVVGIVLFVLVLLFSVAFLIYNNRKLKYQNYNLVRNAGESQIVGGGLVYKPGEVEMDEVDMEGEANA